MTVFDANNNTPTSRGQVQHYAGDQATAIAMQSVDKGGMRGIGLLAMAIAEYALKQKAVDLAQDYYNSNAIDYQYFESMHQPAMQQTAQEAFGANNPYYNYDVYTSVPSGIAKSSIIDRQWFEARRRINKYNVGQMRRLDYDMAVAKAHAVAAGWNVAVRYEYNWTDEHNVRAFNRKLSAANIGIGFGNIVRAGMSSAVGKLTASYDNLGDTIASIGNGYQQRAGYQQAREDVRKIFRPGTPTLASNNSQHRNIGPIQ